MSITVDVVSHLTSHGNMERILRSMKKLHDIDGQYMNMTCQPLYYLLNS